MNKTIVYIGSYSAASGEGIYTFELNHETGELTPAFEPVNIVNPSYLAVSRNKHYLYAVGETQRYDGNCGGSAAAFAISGNGSLKLINTQPTFGIDPCYLSVDKRNEFLIAANYGSGTMTVFPLAQDGAIKPRSFCAAHLGHGPVEGRQNTPHVHFADFTPDEKYIFAVDLGIDAVKFYRLDRTSGTAVPENSVNLTLKPGSGPRHMRFCTTKNSVYIINELSSEIAAFSYSEDYQFKLRQYISTLPREFNKPNTAAALHISHDKRFLYASNRGHDSIAVFRIGDGALISPCGCYFSEGCGPRDFAIDPQENYMLVANEESDEVTVLKLNREAGTLEPTGNSAKVHKPSCIQFNTIFS